MAKKTPAAKPKTTKPAAKRKMVTNAKAVAKPRPMVSDKKLTLQQQIEALQKQMRDLDQESIVNLKAKLADAKKLVSQLEAELATLTGKLAGDPKTKRVRRPSITDEHLQPQLLAVMAKHGRKGMNARQLAEHVHQDAVRVRKFIKDNGKLLKKIGNGAGTKFFLP